jgi:hypothetical protein
MRDSNYFDLASLCRSGAAWGGRMQRREVAARPGSVAWVSKEKDLTDGARGLAGAERNGWLA